MKNKVSIIIPVYNAGKYLKYTLESVVEQTYNNLEIIVIDDGSTDNSENIIRTFLNDKRMRYIKQNNSGVSSARNKGIKVSTGDYLVFVDSDDILEKNAINLMVKSINQYDMVMCGYRYIGKKNCKLKKINMSFNDFNLIVNEILYKKKKYNNINFRTVWGNLYKAEIIKDNFIFFEKDVKYFEDGIFNIKYCRCCKNILINSEIVYQYRVTSDSCISQTKKNLLEHDKNKLRVLNNLNLNKENKNSLDKMIFEMFIDYALNASKINNNYTSKNDISAKEIYFNNITMREIYGLRLKHQIMFLLYKYRLYFIFDYLIKLKK